MEFLNYVVSLPDSKIGAEDSLEELFHQDVGSFFRKIEDKSQLPRMKFSEEEREKQPRNPSAIQLGSDKEEYMEGIRDYAEKVKVYSKYETDRKLSKNIERFTAKEIEEGYLDFKSPALMRIVVKWC